MPANWNFGLILSVGVTGAIFYASIIRWMKRQKSSDSNRTSSELMNPNWLKVGKVKQLFFYPLKSGRGKELDECKFSEFGISVHSDSQFTLRDRMFLVYSDKSGKFTTGRNYPELVLVTLSAVDKSNVRLEAKGMESMVFEVPKSNKANHVDCSMWWGEPIKCNDCGDAAAEWISTFLTGKQCGLRIGVTAYQKRILSQGPWEKFTKVYTTLTNDDTGLFADIASYMLTTEASLNDLNAKLNTPLPSLQFRPNIVISGTEPFAEDQWEWIKIGENVVIRNVKPCPRCTMIRIDPDTANIDDEALKCLRKFRAQEDPMKISVDGIAPTFGIYCGLYSIGSVSIGDDVFVHVP